MFRTAAFGSAGLMMFAMIAAGPASAAEPGICGARTELLAEIETDGATRCAIGFPRGQGIVELWTSEESGTWIVLITSAKGETCLAATGQDHHEGGQDDPDFALITALSFIPPRPATATALIELPCKNSAAARSNGSPSGPPPLT